MSTTKRERLFVSWMVLLVISTVSMAGCRTWELEEEDKIESVSSGEIRASRAIDPTTKHFGFSSKARQIEQNVGIE